VHLFVSRDVIEALAPQLSASHEAVDLWAERLFMYAQALIEAEEKRRARVLRHPVAKPAPRPKGAPAPRRRKDD
jgi:hypothetical protein